MLKTERIYITVEIISVCFSQTKIVFFQRAFDVELLYIAQCFKIPIAEVAVNWTEIEGEC